MKKVNKTGFLKGFLSAALVFGCISSALAASGAVSFSQVRLAMNGNVVFDQSESLTASNGQPIPSSITYTDAAGGGTTYLPLSYISRLLDTPISWDGATNTVSLGTYKGVASGGASLTENPDDGGSLPLTRVGRKAGPFTEVEPIQSEGFPIMARTAYRSTEEYEYDTPVQARNGNHISITITNKGADHLILLVGREYTVGQELISTQVPAGQTVTRTFRVEQTDDGLNPRFYAMVTYYSGLSQDMDFEISATQFNA